MAHKGSIFLAGRWLQGAPEGMLEVPAETLVALFTLQYCQNHCIRVVLVTSRMDPKTCKFPVCVDSLCFDVEVKGEEKCPEVLRYCELPAMIPQEEEKEEQKEKELSEKKQEEKEESEANDDEDTEASRENQTAQEKRTESGDVDKGGDNDGGNRDDNGDQWMMGPWCCAGLCSSLRLALKLATETKTLERNKNNKLNTARSTNRNTGSKRNTRKNGNDSASNINDDTTGNAERDAGNVACNTIVNAGNRQNTNTSTGGKRNTRKNGNDRANNTNDDATTNIEMDAANVTCNTIMDAGNTRNTADNEIKTDWNTFNADNTSSNTKKTSNTAGNTTDVHNTSNNTNKESNTASTTVNTDIENRNTHNTTDRKTNTMSNTNGKTDSLSNTIRNNNTSSNTISTENKKCNTSNTTDNKTNTSSNTNRKTNTTRNTDRYANASHHAATLLGFRGGCLQACAEVSVWTKFCEVEAPAALLSWALAPYGLDGEVEYPRELLRYECHLRRPPILHNALKRAQRQIRETVVDATERDELLCRPLSELPPLSHQFAEGPDMTLADLMLFACFHVLLVTLTSTVETNAITPLVSTWHGTMAQNGYVQMALPVLEGAKGLFCGTPKSGAPRIIVPSVPDVSIYKSDPERSRTTRGAFTRQGDVEEVLRVVEGAEMEPEYMPWPPESPSSTFNSSLSSAASTFSPFFTSSPVSSASSLTASPALATFTLTSSCTTFSSSSSTSFTSISSSFPCTNSTSSSLTPISSSVTSSSASTTSPLYSSTAFSSSLTSSSSASPFTHISSSVTSSSASTTSPSYSSTAFSSSLTFSSSSISSSSVSTSSSFTPVSSSVASSSASTTSSFYPSTSSSSSLTSSSSSISSSVPTSSSSTSSTSISSPAISSSNSSSVSTSSPSHSSTSCSSSTKSPPCTTSIPSSVTSSTSSSITSVPSCASSISPVPSSRTAPLQTLLSSLSLEGHIPESRLARKEQQVENICNAVLALAQPSNVIVDFCSGGGHVGIPLAQSLPGCRVVLVENKVPSLERARERVRQLHLSNVWFVQSNLDYFRGGFDIGVSLHACGVATDLVLGKCMAQRAAFVVVPCCYGSIRPNHVVSYPRSKVYRGLTLTPDQYLILGHAADQTHGRDNPKTEQGQKCMRLVDGDRLARAREVGYVAGLALMHPPTCSPKNHLLMGKSTP